MKDMILEAMRNKYSSLGLSKDILNGYATALAAVVNDASGIPAAVESLEPVLKLVQSDNDRLRAKVKEAEDAAANAKKNPEPANQTETPKPATDDAVPAWAKGLIDRLDSMEKRQVAADLKSKADSRTAIIKNAISSLPETLQPSYMRCDYGNMAEEDFNKTLEQIKTEVSEITTELSAQGAVFKPPFVSTGGNPKELPDKTIDEVVDAMFE